MVHNVRKDCKCLKAVWLVDIAYLCGGLLYYVGRNVELLPLLKTGCIDSCETTPRMMQNILLSLSVVFYRFIPFFISKYYQSNLAKEHQTTEAKLQLVPEWILAAESLTLLAEFDALYTIVVDPFLTNVYNYNLTYFCTTIHVQIIGVWVLWALFVIMYMIILYYTMNIQSFSCELTSSCKTSNIGAILLWAAFSMYLPTNRPILFYCSHWNVTLARILMKVIVLIVVIAVIVLLLVYRCLSKTRQEKLLPRALYQHLHPEPDEHEIPLNTMNHDNTE